MEVEFKFDLNAMTFDRCMLSWLEITANLKCIIAKMEQNELKYLQMKS